MRAEGSGAAGGPRRPPWPEIRRALRERGFRPSRRLGQNFLVDENMARAIAREARVGPGDFVLEVGPGWGALSVQLAGLGVRLFAVEVDPRLAELARGFLAPWPDAEVLVADALAGKHRLEPLLAERLPQTGPWHVVSNLPYSAGTPILVLLARLANPPRAMTVLLQRELALRITAAPGGKEWGPLAVRLQLAYRCRRLRSLPPELFWPRPEVESALVRLELRPDRPATGELGELDLFLETLFRGRRKQLGGILAATLGSREAAGALLAARGLDPRSRPEELDAPSLLALSRGWRERR